MLWTGMTMADLSVLNVRLHGRPIGAITKFGQERTLFSFADDYINDVERPTLGLRFRNRFGDLITEFRPYRMRLMPFLSNLLPEGDLRLFLARHAGVHPEREFSLLRVLGRDLPGAVTVEHVDGDPWPSTDRFAKFDEKPRGRPHDSGLRFSLAGVQLKLSAVKNAEGRLTVPASGIGGNWIVKLPSRAYRGLAENEFSMMTLARKVGIRVPAFGLVDVDAVGNLPAGIANRGDTAFIIDRFDRSDDGSRVHTEDFAQVFDVYAEKKYERASFRRIATVIAAESGHEDVAEFIRRLTFNTLIGNGDMHLKNWSLTYPDDRHARLSPAYDFVSTVPYIPDDQSALNFSRTRKFTGYTEDELQHLSAKAALPHKLVQDAHRETVGRFMTIWSAEKNHLPVGREVMKTIDAHLETLPIVGGNGA